MQNRQKLTWLFLPQSWMNVPTLLGVAKRINISRKFPKKSHFEIRHYVMPLPGGVTEKFYMGAQLHSF